jgi:hypothetical protein
MSTFVRPPLDFDVLKEIWNKYELQDHAVLKVKIVLTMVVKAETQTAPSGSPPLQPYNVDFQSIIIVLTNERGPPDTRTYSQAELNSAITKSDIRFTTITQDWNEYVVDDGARIKVQPVLLGVSKTSKFNNKGLPIYVTNVSINVQIKPPGTQLPSVPT